MRVFDADTAGKSQMVKEKQGKERKRRVNSSSIIKIVISHRPESYQNTKIAISSLLGEEA